MTVTDINNMNVYLKLEQLDFLWVLACYRVGDKIA